MVLTNENCPEKRMEAGEDTEPMVAKEPKKAEVAKVKAEELEVIVEDPTSPTPTVKTKVRIKVLPGFSASWNPIGVVLSNLASWWDRVGLGEEDATYYFQCHS